MRPRRRAEDRHWIRVRENWYRDVWLALITILAIVVLFKAIDAIDQIQQSRLAACNAQNARHDGTVAELGRQLEHFERHAPPARRMEIEASRASTIALINQLAPHQNCVAVVHRTAAPRRR